MEKPRARLRTGQHQPSRPAFLPIAPLPPRKVGHGLRSCHLSCLFPKQLSAFIKSHSLTLRYSPRGGLASRGRGVPGCAGLPRIRATLCGRLADTACSVPQPLKPPSLAPAVSTWDAAPVPRSYPCHCGTQPQPSGREAALPHLLLGWVSGCPVCALALMWLPNALSRNSLFSQLCASSTERSRMHLFSYPQGLAGYLIYGKHSGH